MTTEHKFWRLLGVYEKLMADEGVALREINLAALARLTEQKAIIAEAVLTLATSGGPSLPAERFEALQAKQAENLAVAQEQLAQISSERQNLAIASQRLAHVGRAYNPEAGNPSSLQGQG